MNDAGKISFLPKGEYDSGAMYEALDVVKYDGMVWVAKKSSKGITPAEGENWMCLLTAADYATADAPGIVKPDGDTIEVSTDATISVSSKALTFADHDTATSGTSFTDAEDGNMIVTDWTNNLLNPTLETHTNYGITCTANGDGTYTLNGTPSITGKHFGWRLVQNLQKNIYGGCLFTGAPLTADGYRLYVGYFDDNDTWKAEKFVGSEGIVIDGSYPRISFEIVLDKGASPANNLLFKPMLTTDLSATYDDFVPYGGYEIKSCGKNLLNTKIGHGGYDGGITSEIKSDGSYSFKGTATSSTINIWILGSYGNNLPTVLSLEPGTYFVKGVLLYKDTEQIANGNYGSIVNFTEKQDITGVRALDAVVGKTYDEIYYPIIALSDTDTPFEPYTGETITVTNATEAPAFGLKSHKGITNIISPGNVKCVYPTNESGKGVLDAMYNNSQLSNELSKLKNAIIAMGGTV